MKNGLRNLALTGALIVGGFVGATYNPARNAIAQEALDAQIKAGVCPEGTKLPALFTIPFQDFPIDYHRSPTFAFGNPKTQVIWHIARLPHWFTHIVQTDFNDPLDYIVSTHEVSHYCSTKYVENLQYLGTTNSGLEILISEGLSLFYRDPNQRNTIIKDSILEEARATFDEQGDQVITNIDEYREYNDVVRGKYMEILVDYYNLNPHQVTLRQFLEQIFKRDVTADEIEAFFKISNEVYAGEKDITQAINYIDQLIREGVTNE